MAKSSYPTGVENHGGSLRIWFIYQGVRVRENLGVPDTPKNRKTAGELRSSVCFSIKMGNFNYASQFPESLNLKKFGVDKKEITVSEIAEKWLELKRIEMSSNGFVGYVSIVKNMVPRIGGDRFISSVNREDLLLIRKELLTGWKVPQKGHKPSKGRTVPTVNNYMTIISGMFNFAVASGYTTENPFNGISALTRSRPDPDPLSRDEFLSLLDSCKHTQIRNIWALAVYTGIRHGELASLAWEDIDLKAGTMMIRRNFTPTNEFTMPKTKAGTNRVVFLIEPAIEALRSQAEMTRFGKQHEVEVNLREYGRKEKHECTFVFDPRLTGRNYLAGDHYAVGSIKKIWDAHIKRAGLRHRNAYQTRHTYACWSLSAGANPNFIATQMGHADAQMVYKVYGKWMAEKNTEQVALLNQKLADFAPSLPHDIALNG